MEEIEQVLAKINAMLASDFDIAHATIQTEREGACRSVDESGSAVYCGEHIAPRNPSGGGGPSQR
jgi:hypothetical protein